MRIRFSLMVLFVFLIGIGPGIYLGMEIQQRHFIYWKTHIKEILLKRFDRELKLNQEQKDKVDKILTEGKEKIQKIREELRTKMRQIRENSKEEISKILQENQKEKFYKIMEEYENKWRRFYKIEKKEKK